MEGKWKDHPKLKGVKTRKIKGKEPAWKNPLTGQAGRVLDKVKKAQKQRSM